MAPKKSVETSPEAAKARLAQAGRNEPCPCGSGKKYKKCHLQEDEAAASPPAGPPDPDERLQNGWRLVEQRRPGAAEKEFKAALELKADLVDAVVGIGMAKLQAGDNDGARTELSKVVKLSEKVAADLKNDKAKDGFTRKEAQPYIRASHALGCLAYDQARYDEALESLSRVYEVDEGTVGTEARLVAGKTLVKLNRPADAVPILEHATKGEGGAGRAHVGLALAQFLAGNEKAALEALDKALEHNLHFGKAVLRQLRGRADNPLGATPGSREEALIYAQTYGDVWDDAGKKFLEAALQARHGRSSESVAAPAG